MKFDTDETGTPLCPVPHLSWEWDDDDRHATMRPCHEPVDLTITCSVPLELGIELSVLSCGVDATASCWTVQCGRGHVLAVSDSDDGGAEAFSWNQVFGTQAPKPEEGS